jgi:hypothetical protein
MMKVKTKLIVKMALTVGRKLGKTNKNKYKPETSVAEKGEESQQV